MHYNNNNITIARPSCTRSSQSMVTLAIRVPMRETTTPFLVMGTRTRSRTSTQNPNLKEKQLICRSFQTSSLTITTMITATSTLATVLIIAIMAVMIIVTTIRAKGTFQLNKGRAKTAGTNPRMQRTAKRTAHQISQKDGLLLHSRVRFQNRSLQTRTS